MRQLKTLCVPLLFFALLAGCAQQRTAAPANRVYQTSTINALLAGVYDGDLTLAELRKQGNFGLGTFSAVDGEMVLLDGVFYQVRADGKAYRPDLGTTSPFAAITFFSPTQTVVLSQSLSYDTLRAKLDGLRSSPNVPCAFRLDGEFDLVCTRSVPAQTPPYRRLAEVTKTQPTFEHRRVRGTVVGYWMPQCLQELNVPGYHLHFLTEDRSAGGHALDCRPRNVRVQMAELNEVLLRIPTTASFRHTGLGEAQRDELRAVEQATRRPAH